MSRHYPDWLKAYTEYASFTESPAVLHYWAGVSAVAGVLGRRVWIDMVEFQWFPNFYIIFVGPPDVVRKTTTSGIAEKMLAEVETVKFGPTIASWQSLITELSEATEVLELANGDQVPINSLYICSSELGNFLDPTDKKSIDALVTLWDGGRIVKSTKNNGKEYMDNTLLNLLGCTTPSWITGSVPPYLAEGGLFSRMLFVYAERREKRVAYPSLSAKPDAALTREKLIEDLRDMASITGPVELDPGAVKWGTEWYDKLCDRQESGKDIDLLARKQVQLHKVAMVLAASRHQVTDGHYVITASTLSDAADHLDILEPHRGMVFNQIGRSQDAVKADLIVNYIRMKGSVSLQALYHALHSKMPKSGEFQQILRSTIQAGLVRRTKENDVWYLHVAAKR